MFTHERERKAMRLKSSIQGTSKVREIFFYINWENKGSGGGKINT